MVLFYTAQNTAAFEPLILVSIQLQTHENVFSIWSLLVVLRGSEGD